MHHVHLFAEDVDATVAWYQHNLGAEVMFDGDFGGARNVFMQLGTGRINLYDQRPRGDTQGPYHHIGIQTDDLAGLRERLLANGVEFRSDIREFDLLHHDLPALRLRFLHHRFPVFHCDLLDRLRFRDTRIFK